MKPAKLLGIFIVFLIIISALFIWSRKKPEQSSNLAVAASQNPQGFHESPFQPQTDEQGEVGVQIIPQDLSKDSKVWKFQVTMNTHSVELDNDMVRSATLIDDSGRQYPALSWEGGESGHHRQGTLSFAPITPTPKFVEIRISGIGGIESRSFKWQLNN